MKNKLLPSLFILPVVTGICGALLRSSQLIHAYDHETGILKSGEPVTYGLVAVCVIAALIAVLAAFLLKNGAEIRSLKLGKGLLMSGAAASAVIIIYAGMLFFSLFDEFDATSLILALFSVYCAVSLLVLSKYSFAERDSTAYNVFSAVPAFWACFMLILAFREKISDPIIANYVPLMFAYLAILMFCYAMAAHVLGKNKKHVAVFACFFGIFFILMEIVSPFIAGTVPNAESIRYMLPQLAFLILMPCTTAQILKK
ncbi:MAG: hypothetical protein IJ299_06030 [Oscillospiraceae bacterium]|nr:hypothetical protein [Oscillospiraceae bacterium]